MSSALLIPGSWQEVGCPRSNLEGATNTHMTCLPNLVRVNFYVSVPLCCKHLMSLAMASAEFLREAARWTPIYLSLSLCVNSVFLAHLSIYIKLFFYI